MSDNAAPRSATVTIRDTVGLTADVAWIAAILEHHASMLQAIVYQAVPDGEERDNALMLLEQGRQEAERISDSIMKLEAK